MGRRLILWDVDGTLVWTGPATRHAFDRAVSGVLGRAVGDHGVSLGGKTDPQIAMEIFAAVGVPNEEAHDRLPDALKAIETELAAVADALREHGTVLPGVRDLLQRMADRLDVVQTVLTGNTEVNGRLKVHIFGLDRYLDMDVGAYGSDNADRRELVPVALDKLERRRGIRVEPADAWVIGDTPLDLVCARAGGARCLLVATGRVTFEELAAAGAEAALPDLSDVEAVERLLLGEPVGSPA
jgi:phosphoglycolate phosphatase-like HAD superfamily hydrolase